MKHLEHIILILAIMAGIATTMMSCGSDEPGGGNDSGGDNKNTVVFTLTPSEVYLAAAKNSTATFQIEFTSDEGTWRVTEAPSFVFLSASSGTGTATLTVTAKESNESNLQPREGTIKVEVRGNKVVTQSLRVVQQCQEGTIPKDMLAMSDGLAFGWASSSETKYFYWDIFAQSDYDHMSENEIITKVTSHFDKRIVPGDGQFSYVSHLQPNTQYIIVTVSFDKNEKQGGKKVTQVKTKPDANQPEAVIENVSYYRKDGTNQYYYGWNTKMNSCCQRYYTYCAASDAMFGIYRLMEEGETTPVAWYLFNEIKKGNSTHSTTINDGFEDLPFAGGRDLLYALQSKNSFNSIEANLDSDRYLIILTWGANGNGELSGRINAQYYDLTED